MESLSRSLTRSYGASLNKSLTQPGFLEAYYNFQYSTHSPNVQTPTKDMAYFAAVEDSFCKDFACCGIQLIDMHALLEHFEECHVVVESDVEEEDDLTFQFESQDVEMADTQSGTACTDMYFNKPKRNHVSMSDIYQNDTVTSAFDTSIIRRRQQSPPQPWRNTDTIESPPQTFPVHIEQNVNTIDIMQVDPPVEVQSTSPRVKRSDNGVSSLPPPVIDSKSSGGAGILTNEEEVERPYKCKIVGCNKSYKNPGGLKYHMHHGHCEDTGDPEMNNIIHKPYQCTVLDCGKRYKNLNGLKV
ncbi:hypothetical protein BC833DRAFT_617571 [Globomyces pollinis-pini]|nr:hypothetical protein BC833DRAFT_617571 [Globomyces pollinis-pini]